MHMQGEEFDQVQRLIQVLEEAIAFILNRKDNSSTDQVTKEKLTRSRWIIRCYAWIIAHILLCWSEQASFANRGKKRWAFHNGRQLKQDQTAYQQALDYYLDLCVSFALLELRIRGEVDPWEGVLLVKERS